MLQEINLLGIRKQTILCHFEKICDLAVMKEITETDEKNIDKGLRFNTGTQFIAVSYTHLTLPTTSRV